MKKYDEANTNDRLDNLGPLSTTRWNHIGEVHVLFPSEQGHIYIARRADLPHYQEMFPRFLSTFEDYDDGIEVYVYLKGEDYGNHFMTVRNSYAAVKEYVDRIDWFEIHRLACDPKKKVAKGGRGSLETKRAAIYEDTGFCSSVCQTRIGTSDGISVPRLKPETLTEPAVVNGYSVLSKFVRNTVAKWSGNQRSLYVDPSQPERQEKFAGKIHSTNVLECMRLSVTDITSKCGCHRDLHNSTNPAFSAVVGVSVIRNINGIDQRVAVNAQGRRSVDESIDRSRMYGPMLRMVADEYERMPEERKVVSRALLVGRDLVGMHGFRCIKNPCNMDPMAYYQPFLHYTLRLIEHFGLSFPETMSVVAAIEVVPNTAYFFSAAAEALLATPQATLSRCHRGFAFGYLLASILVNLRRIRSNSCTGVRFNLYWEPEVPDGKEWEDRCSLKTLACLRFHAAYATLVDKKKRALQYKKLRKHFCSNTVNVDLLVTNHVLGICSCIGLLPAWVRNEIEVSSSSRYMRWFLGEFEIPSGPESLDQITESLRHALEYRFGILFSRRTIENILCKVYRNRTKSTSDARFCDLAFLGQIQVTCEGDGLRISFDPRTGLQDTFVDDYLITRWAFGNTLLSVEEMNGRLGTSLRGVPSATEASVWSVPDPMMFPRSQTTLDFDIGDKVEVSCDRLLRTNFERVSQKLRGGN